MIVNGITGFGTMMCYAMEIRTTLANLLLCNGISGNVTTGLSGNT